jgi:peptidoglycan hydrolase-like protein with peptidoglycan-binding domain
MPLRSLRFAGDPVLEACIEGSHRMLLNEEGLAVARVQAALVELGSSVGQAGVDGTFGPDTGNAVSSFKMRHGLQPADPVVGVGTMTALDDAFFVDPALLDPTFLEFTPFVAARRLEPFVAIELAKLLSAPLDSWRHMAARFALDSLSADTLAGIVAGSRFGDLSGFVVAHAAAVQPDGTISTDWFERERQGFVEPDGRPRRFGGSAVTFPFRGADGGDIGIIVVSDDLIRGKERTVVQATGQSLPVTIDETLIHELTHLRNGHRTQDVLATSDLDAGVFTDPVLAQSLTLTTSRPTAQVLLEFLEEISARHVEWHIRQEVEGHPLNINLLTPEQFAAAVISYMVEFPTLFDAGNGYVHVLNARPDAVTARLDQAALWLRQLDTFGFSDRAQDEAAVHDRLLQAADFCQEQANASATSDPSDPAGLTPLLQDFP